MSMTFTSEPSPEPREEGEGEEDEKVEPRDHVTEPAGHVTSDGPPAGMSRLDTPFNRARSATVSGGGRPKFRSRKPKKSPSNQEHDQSHVTARDSHVTSASAATSAEEVGERLERKEEEEAEEESAGGGNKDQQYIMKCQVGRSKPSRGLCTSREG